jgi:hypothetical protein
MILKERTLPMPQAKRTITADDIMPMEDFAKVRAERRGALLPVKKLRRIALGPDATFYFESFATMWQQIHEMLFIEKGGAEQLADELAAYNPLIPKGDELVATLMFEINDAERRARVLRQLTDVELAMFIQVGQDKIFARPEQEVERTAPDGKTSSVHFLHFPFSQAQKEAFAMTQEQVVLGCDHENYRHLTVLSPQSKQELSKDFDG